MSEKNLAALDIGTNSFHLIIARVHDNGYFKIVARRREVLRIAADCWNSEKIITESEIERSIKTLLDFRKTAETYNAEIRAVATSTVREAVNREVFVSEIYKHTGIKIEPVTGQEEARIIFLGASKALNFDNHDVFCFDIGGGSTELILRSKGEFIFSESLKLGAVRLSKMFFPDYLITNDGVDACEQHILNLLKNNPSISFNNGALINAGTSGTVQSAVLLSRSAEKKLSPGKLNGYTLTYDEFMEVFLKVMNKKTPAERKSIQGMETKRADIIPAGLLILKSIFELFHLNEIVYSDFALREGLILSQL